MTTNFFCVVPDSHKAAADKVFAGRMSAQRAAETTAHLTHTHWLYLWLGVPEGEHRDYLAAFSDGSLTAPVDGGYTQTELDDLQGVIVGKMETLTPTTDPVTGDVTPVPAMDAAYRDAELATMGFQLWVDPSQLYDAIRAHRAKRVQAGHTFTLTGGVTVALSGALETQMAVFSLADKARELQTAGVTTPVLPITGSDYVRHKLTPAQMLELFEAGRTWVQSQHNVEGDMIEGVGAFPGGPPSDWRDVVHWGG